MKIIYEFQRVSMVRPRVGEMMDEGPNGLERSCVLELAVHLMYKFNVCKREITK